MSGFRNAGTLLIVFASLFVPNLQTAFAQSREATRIVEPLQLNPPAPANTPKAAGANLRAPAPKPLNSSKDRAQDPCTLARQRFVKSAMLYDSNRDQRLAYHETLNLLISIGRSQLIVRQQTTLTSSSTPADASAFNGQSTADTSLQLRQFVGVFMQLSRQFDVNQDRFLNERELTNFADMLIQFDPGVAGQECLASRGAKPVTPRGFRRYEAPQATSLSATPAQIGGSVPVYNLCPSAAAASSNSNSAIGLVSPTVPAGSITAPSQSANPSSGYPGYIIQSQQPATSSTP